MPIDPTDLRSSIATALSDKVLSEEEAERILDKVREAGGIDDAGAAALIESLSEALRSDGLDLTTAARQRNLNHLLASLDRQTTLPLDRGPNRPGTTTNYVELLRNTAIKPTILPLGTFGGGKVAVTPEGGLQIDGANVDFNMVPPNDALIDALWALNRPRHLAGLPDEQKALLFANLIAQLDTALEVNPEDPRKFDRYVAVTAAIGALAEGSAAWDAATVDKMLDYVEKCPTPLMKALILRGAQGATLTDAQRSRFGGIEKPEAGDELLAHYDKMRAGTERAGWTQIEGQAAQFALNALTFAKNEASVENILGGMEVWKGLDGGSSWSAETVGRMHAILETYVENYPQVVYVYGTFKTNAPKEVAKITSGKAVESAKPGLTADPPTLRGFPLTRAQADYILSIIGDVRNDDAVQQLVRCLDMATSAFEASAPSRWNDPQADAPLNQAAWGLFQRAAHAYQDGAEGTETGKLEYSDLLANMKEEVGSIRTALAGVLPALAGDPPKWGDTEIDRTTADYLTDLMKTRLRSAMSVENIGRAVAVVANHHGGSIDAAAGEKLRGIVDGYIANWPDTQFLDFNKLERIATYAVRGESLPPTKINGQVIQLGAFYDAVATGVRDAVDPARLRHAWMADRWGFRAKQAVEVLDVVAEQAARNEGPLALLRERYPNAEITVQVSGRAGDHEQLTYVVNDRGRKTTFNQGSDGTVARYRQSVDPILLTATIGAAGDLDIQIPERLSIRYYPLQQTYGVGDKIDFYFKDDSVSETHEEGETFSTKSKVLEAEITGFTADGKYTVNFTAPDGTEQTKTVPLSTIRKANNPHFFDYGAYRADYSDIKLDLKNDEALRKFLEEAQPIIDKYLPRNNPNVNLAAMSPQELARRQKACIKELMEYAGKHMDYPRDKDSSRIDDESKRYYELIDGWGQVPFGELIKIKKGVCRHQCILEHILLQQAGIDSRLAAGAANTSSGKFRGFHIWVEVTLADGERFLSDQTWSNPYIPLWSGAYDTDKRRVEMYYRTARYDRSMVD